jgi:hypothetical protein
MFQSLIAEDLNRRAPTGNGTGFKLFVVVINDSYGTIEDRPKSIQGICSWGTRKTAAGGNSITLCVAWYRALLELSLYAHLLRGCGKWANSAVEKGVILFSGIFWCRASRFMLEMNA